MNAPWSCHGITQMEETISCRKSRICWRFGINTHIFQFALLCRRTGISLGILSVLNFNPIILCVGELSVNPQKGRYPMRFLSCLVVWALCAVGYAQGVPQATTSPVRPQPNVAARPVNNGYWYRAINGRWYWHVRAPSRCCTNCSEGGSGESHCRAAAGPDRVRPAGHSLLVRPQPVDQRAIARTATRSPAASAVDECMGAPQNTFLNDDWFSRHQRGEDSGDPNLFQ